MLRTLSRRASAAGSPATVESDSLCSTCRSRGSAASCWGMAACTSLRGLSSLPCSKAQGRPNRRPVQACGLPEHTQSLWMPSSERRVELASKSEYNIVCNQGPPPPNPLVMERFQSVVSQLFQQRIVRLGGAVDDDMANLLVAQLLYLDSVDPKKDITMYVNSPGGSVTAGMAVFDTMRHIRPDVSTCCIGLAASMGAFILASGQQGKRYSLPNSRIMIHQPLGGAQGQATDIEIQANEILHHKLTLNGYLSQFSGQSMETITRDTDRDFFMSPQEAIEYGLIDAIIAKPQLIQQREFATA